MNFLDPFLAMFTTTPIWFRISLWGIIGLGCGLIIWVVSTRIQSVDVPRIEEQIIEHGESRATTAEDYLAGQGTENEGDNSDGSGKETVSHSLESAEDSSQISPDDSDFLSDMLNKKVGDAILGAKLSLRLDAPVKVKNGRLYLDLQDGEIGRLVVENKKEELPTA